MKKNTFKILLISATILLFTGCSSVNYNVTNIKGTSLDDSEKILISNANIYLVNGGDGRKMTFLSLTESNELAEESGVSALNIAHDALSHYSDRIIAEREVLLEDKALEIGTINKSDYLIYSRVEEWSNPLGINCANTYYDEASVLLSIYSVQKKELINTSRLTAKSCPTKVNGLPVSTGSPEKLYKVLFSQWLDEFFK